MTWFKTNPSKYLTSTVISANVGDHRGQSEVWLAAGSVRCRVYQLLMFLGFVKLSQLLSVMV